VDFPAAPIPFWVVMWMDILVDQELNGSKLQLDNNELDSCRKVSGEFPDICTCICDEESDYVMFNNGKGGGICSSNTAIIKDECLDAALEVGGVMSNLFRNVLNVGTWSWLLHLE
jgi:hypothetical protein